MRKILTVYPQSIFHISEHFIDVKFNYDENAMSILQENSANADGGINGGVNGGVEFSETELNILACLTKNNELNAGEIAKQLGIGKRTVERVIKSLKMQGIIERIGSDKTGHWEIRDYNK